MDRLSIDRVVPDPGEKPMSMMMQAVSEPMSSSEIPATDAERLADVERKHARIAEFLSERGYDALLLQTPANFAWFTSGGDSTRGGNVENAAALFITADARVVVTTNVDSQQLFDCQLSGLGFQLKQRAWFEGYRGLVDDLCRGRNVASDVPTERVRNAVSEIASLRTTLGDVERIRLRSLGNDVAHAVEAAARQLRPGRSESEVAGEVGHRLLKRGIDPLSLRVAADGRTRLYRGWSHSPRPVQRFAVIAAVGRRQGLCAGCARTVTFGEPHPDLWAAYARTMLIHATAIYFSQAGWTLRDVWSRMQRIYEKFGSADEWQLSEQGAVVGYSPTEHPVVPRSEFRLEPGTAVHWHPSIGPTLAGDTILVEEAGIKRVTIGDPWPVLAVEVKGSTVNCPDILRLPAPTTFGGMHVHLTDEGDSILNFSLADSLLETGRESDSVIE